MKIPRFYQAGDFLCNEQKNELNSVRFSRNNFLSFLRR